MIKKMIRTRAVLPGLLIVLLCCGCSLNYGESYEENGLVFHPAKIGNSCYVSPYYWDGNREMMDIRIPDTFNGHKVTALGGFSGSGAPSPFYIILPFDGPVSDPTTSEQPFEYTVTHLKFTLYLGPNIREMRFVIENDYYQLDNAEPDEGVLFFHATVYVICSEDNKHFYSVDGKLYNKDDDSLVEEFDYSADFG